MNLTQHLGALGADIDPLLDELGVPLYLVDADGLIRWQNRASVALTGDLRGSGFASVVSSEDRSRVQTRFSRYLFADDGPTEFEVVVLARDGVRRRVRTRSHPIKIDGELVGVFGAVISAVPDDDPPPEPLLTPRQLETLRLLAAGASTKQIATELGVAVETARNHVRRLFRNLGAHSRIEAVARGRETGLI